MVDRTKKSYMRAGPSLSASQQNWANTLIIMLRNNEISEAARWFCAGMPDSGDEVPILPAKAASLPWHSGSPELLALMLECDPQRIGWWLRTAEAWLDASAPAAAVGAVTSACRLIDDGADVAWDDLASYATIVERIADVTKPARPPPAVVVEGPAARKQRVQTELGLDDQTGRLSQLAADGSDYEYIRTRFSCHPLDPFLDLSVWWQRLGANAAAVEQILIGVSGLPVSSWLIEVKPEFRDALRAGLTYCGQALRTLNDPVTAYAVMYLTVLFDDTPPLDAAKPAPDIREATPAAVAREFCQRHAYLRDRLCESVSPAAGAIGGSAIVDELLQRGDIALAGRVLWQHRTPLSNVHGSQVIARQLRTVAEAHGWLGIMLAEKQAAGTRTMVAGPLLAAAERPAVNALCQAVAPGARRSTDPLAGLSVPRHPLAGQSDHAATCVVRLGRTAGSNPRIGCVPFGPDKSILYIGPRDSWREASRLVDALKGREAPVLWLHQAAGEAAAKAGASLSAVQLRLGTRVGADNGTLGNAVSHKDCVEALARGLTRLASPGVQRWFPPLWTPERVNLLLNGRLGPTGFQDLLSGDEMSVKKLAVYLADNLLGRPVCARGDLRRLSACIEESMPAIRACGRALRIEWDEHGAGNSGSYAGAAYLVLDRGLPTDAFVLPVVLAGSWFQQVWRQWHSARETDPADMDWDPNPRRISDDPLIAPEAAETNNEALTNPFSDFQVGGPADDSPLLPPDGDMLWSRLGMLGESAQTHMSIVFSGRWGPEIRDILRFLAGLDRLGHPRVAIGAFLDLDGRGELDFEIDRGTAGIFDSMLYSRVGERTRRALSVALGHCGVGRWDATGTRTMMVRRATTGLRNCEIIPC